MLMCVLHLLAQQAHEVAGCVGVKAERRDDDVGGSVSPVLVVILHPVQHCVSHCGLCVDHLTWRDSEKSEDHHYHHTHHIHTDIFLFLH